METSLLSLLGVLDIEQEGGGVSSSLTPEFLGLIRRICQNYFDELQYRSCGAVA